MDSLLGGSRFSRSVGRTLRVLIKETHQTSILEIRCKSTRFFRDWLGNLSQFHPNFIPILAALLFANYSDRRSSLIYRSIHDTSYCGSCSPQHNNRHPSFSVPPAIVPALYSHSRVDMPGHPRLSPFPDPAKRSRISCSCDCRGCLCVARRYSCRRCENYSLSCSWGNRGVVLIYCSWI